MAKRTLRAESKKECPSCGLGVTVDSTICEFCGWNFEEEDEWILQIEKLERDLMLEKQKYEPGTVDHMLESTLRSPLLDRVESTVPRDEDAMDVEDSVPEYPDTAEEAESVRDDVADERYEEEIPSSSQESEASKVRRVRSVRTPPVPSQQEPPMREEPEEEAPEMRPEPPSAMPIPIRKVRSVAPQQAEQTPQRRVRTVAQRAEPEVEEPEQPVRRTRTVRRVKR